MERSDAMRDALSALIETFGTDQMEAAWTQAVSLESGSLLIGTDPAEWWDSPEDLARVLKAQSEELYGATVKVTHVDAFVEGGMAWGAAKVDVDFPGVPTRQLRFTSTLTRADEGWKGWKIVQAHVSVGAPNEDVVGKELTV